MRKKNYSSSNLCIIYALRNTVNNKIYIGQTWRPLHVRWNSGNGYDECIHIHRAINKHGKENFYYDVLVVAHTQELADYWEGYFIHKYNTIDRSKGYNLNSGGGNPKPNPETRQKMSKYWKDFYLTHPAKNKGKPMSDDQKKKISMASIGKVMSAEARAKMSKANKGNKNCVGRQLSQESKDKMSAAHKGRASPNKGKKFSDEAKRHMSESHKGFRPSEETKRKRSEAMKGKTWKVIDGKRVYSPKIIILAQVI